MSEYLKDCKCCLLEAFKATPVVRVQCPTNDKMAKYGAMIMQLQPELQGVFGFVDSLNLAIQEQPAGALQNTYYNCWLGCFCSSLFYFAPDSTIIWDSELSLQLGGWLASEAAVWSAGDSACGNGNCY